MRTTTRLTAAACLVLVVTAGACADGLPTDAPLAPAGARLNGVGFGSGNITGGAPTVDPDGTGSTMAVDTGSTAMRGGVGFGSGN